MAALRQLAGQNGEDVAVWKFMAAGELARAQRNLEHHQMVLTLPELWGHTCGSSALTYYLKR